MRLLVRRAKHLGTPDKIGTPDPPEALVELDRIERVNLRPRAVETLGPNVERECVVPAKILDVHDLEPMVFHRDDNVGEARNPATGKHVLADKKLSFAATDVADEVKQSEAARLEAVGVGLDHLVELIPSGVLEHSDRNDFVERALTFPKVCLDHPKLRLQSPSLDVVTNDSHLFGGGVDARDMHAIPWCDVEHEAAKPASDVDDLFTLAKQELAADMVNLVDLCLFKACGLGEPIGAGVHHQRIIEPVAVERGAESIVGARILLGALVTGVRVPELVPSIALIDQGVGRIVAARHPGTNAAPRSPSISIPPLK